MLSLAARLFCRPTPSLSHSPSPQCALPPLFSAAPAARQSHLPHTFSAPPSVSRRKPRSLPACLPASLPACLRLSECVTARRPKLAAAAATCHSALVGLASNASGTTLLCELAFRARSASPSSSHPLALLRASHAHTSILPRISSSLVPAIAQLAHAPLRCIQTPTSSSTRSTQSRIHQPALQVSVVDR
jgi:hypothetical protein